jgi:hypothetical protein
VPDGWLPQLADILKLNPHILEIGGRVDQNSRAELEERRNKWGENSPGALPRTVPNEIHSCFCFAPKFYADGHWMHLGLTSDETDMGVLLFKTEEAREIRVNFWHRGNFWPSAYLRVEWTLMEAPLDVEFPFSQDRRWNSFTVKVPAGLHQMKIRIIGDSSQTYRLRKVWVTPVEEEQATNDGNF